MKRVTKLFFILWLLAIVFQTKATHYLGGEMSWDCVGQDSFMISLTLYRDCNGVNFSTAYIIANCVTTSQRIDAINVPVPPPLDITPVCDSSCTRCESNGCSFPYGIEKYTYQQLFVLTKARSCCKVKFFWSGCCRNTTITTGMSSGTIWVEGTLDRCVAPCDNSPKFTNPPTSIICIGQDFIYNGNGFDSDNDSLSYEWIYPKGSGGSNLSYSGMYDYNKPIFFWGFPNTNLPIPRGFHLDENTGQIQFRPMKVEQTVMALKVSEYRNGVKIGEITRDMQIIVLSCANNQAPILSGPFYKEFCLEDNDTVKFEISTMDYDTLDNLSIEYFGNIPGAKFSHDSAQHPTGTFTWVPKNPDFSKTYQFYVKASDNTCPVAGSTTRVYQFRMMKKPDSMDFKILNSYCDILDYKVEIWPKQDNFYNIYFYDSSSNPAWSRNSRRYLYENKTVPVKVKVNHDTSSCSATFYDTFEIGGPFEIYNLDTIFTCKGNIIDINPTKPKDSSIYLTIFHHKDNLKIISDTVPVYSGYHPGNLKLIIQLLDTINYCSLYDTVKVISFEDNTKMSTHLDICKSIDSFPLHAFPFDSNSLWIGDGVVKSNGKFYFLTNKFLNNDTINLLYYPNQKLCNYFKELNIKVIDEKSGVLKDTVHLCETNPELVLTSPFTNNNWSGSHVSGNKFLNPDKDTGTFTVYLSVNEASCSVTDSQIIQVHPNQYLTAIVLNNPICSGDSIYVEANLKYPDVSELTWWGIEEGEGYLLFDTLSLNNIYIPDELDYHHQYVTLIVKTKELVCSNKQRTLDIPINYSPEADFIADSTTGFQPLKVCFTNKSKCKNAYIKNSFWDFGNSQSSLLSSPCYTYDNPGLYTVTLVIESSKSCLDTIVKTDFINVYSTSIKDFEELGISIFPNPFTSKILIKSKKPIQSIRLINFEGKVVLNSEAKENQTELSTENLPKGIYMLEIEMEAGEVFRQTLIKN